jgi:hypothetical protein
MESAHAFIKSHLLSPQQTFTSIIQLISKAIKAQYHEITFKHYQQKITTLQYVGTFFRLCTGKIMNYALQKAHFNHIDAKLLGPKNHCNH